MKFARLIIRGRLTGVRVGITETAPERMRGLLYRDRLPPDEGLLLKRCNSIHTFGMRFAIDVVFLDRNEKIVAIYRDIPRWRVLFSFRATQTLELAASEARRLGLTVGDTLVFEDVI